MTKPTHLEHCTPDDPCVDCIDVSERELCDFCGGTGEIDVPAMNVGGEIVGPDTRPCPVCRIKDNDEYPED